MPVDGKEVMSGGAREENEGREIETAKAESATSR